MDFSIIQDEKIPPKSISGGMGAQVFMAWQESIDEINQQADFILAKPHNLTARLVETLA